MKIASPGDPADDTTPTIDRCLAHRCERHDNVPPLNLEEGGGRSECGACIGEDLFRLERDVLWPVLDSLADRMIYGAHLREKLNQARVRLNLLEPGAGDALTEEDHDEARTR